MRFIVEATKDINMRIGDRVFNHKKGDAVKLSGAGVETALSEHTDGAFKFVKSVAENDDEKKRVAMEESVAHLLEKPKSDLVKVAAKAGIENAADLRKEPLVDAIIEAKVDNQTGMDSGISHLAVDKSQNVTKAKK